MGIKTKLTGAGTFVTWGIGFIGVGWFQESPGLVLGAGFMVSAGLYKKFVHPRPRASVPDWVYRICLLLQGGLVISSCTAFAVELIAFLNTIDRPGVEAIFGFVFLPMIFLMGLAMVITGIASSDASAKVLGYIHRTPSHEDIKLW